MVTTPPTAQNAAEVAKILRERQMAEQMNTKGAIPSAGPVIAVASETSAYLAECQGILGTIMGIVGMEHLEAGPDKPSPSTLREWMEHTSNQATNLKDYLQALKNVLGG